MNVPRRARIIAVQNYGASGTLFLQSLLDSHPQVLMTPALYSRDFYVFWERHSSKSQSQIIDAFMDEHAYWFSIGGAKRKWGLHQMGKRMDEAIWIPQDRFEAALRSIISGAEPCSRKDFFIAIYSAYAIALGRAVPDDAVIVFPIHSLPKRYAVLLVEDFPDAKFLYTVREPIRTIGSAIKHLIHEGKSLNPFECALKQMLLDVLKRDSSYVAYNAEPYDEKYHMVSRAVRLEDLHEHPKQTLTALCRWIGIPWSDTLLQSTFDGKEWWNRPESPRVAGFSTAIIRQHASSFSWFDILRLQTLLIRKYRRWNYPHVPYAYLRVMRLCMPAALFVPFGAELRIIPSRLFFALRAIRRACDRVLYNIRSVLRLDRPLGVGRFLGYAIRLLSAGIVAVLAVPASLFFLVRDYSAIRIVLIRAWVRLWRPSHEVDLLTIDVGERD